MSKLKPCPFCGREVKIIRIGNAHTKSRKSQIHCYACSEMTVGAIRYGHDWTDEKLTEKWNARPNEDKLNAELEKCPTQAQYDGCKVALHKAMSEIADLRDGLKDIETIARYNSGTGIHAHEPLNDIVWERIKGILQSHLPEFGGQDD